MGALNSRAALASASVAIILFALKGFAVWQTESIAMLGSLADTGLDLIASLVTLFAVRVAAQPADLEHRFGHGKAEALAALFQVGLIGVAAAGIIARSVSRYAGTGEPPGSAGYGIGVSVFAIALTLVLIAYQARVIRATDRSPSAPTAPLYQRSRAQWRGHPRARAGSLSALARRRRAVRARHRPVASLGRVADRDACRQPADGPRMPIEKVERFLEVASKHPELKGIHDLRTRTSGAHDFVQFHMWVDPRMTVAQAHDVMDEIEAKLMAEFPGVEILIHTDPHGHADSNDPITERDAQALVADLKAARE